MIKFSKSVKDTICATLLCAAVVMQILSFSRASSTGNTHRAAKLVSRQVETRMKLLDNFAAKALSQAKSNWLSLEGLPEDMVIYKYYADSLHSWQNEFPISNDDIKSELLIPYIINPRVTPLSPLIEVSETPGYYALGEKWYILKSYIQDDCKVIAGIEILNEQSVDQTRGINRKLQLEKEFSIYPLSYDGGDAVILDGLPIFTIVCESTQSSVPINSSAIWISLSLLILAALLFVSSNRSFKRLAIASSFIFGVMLLIFFMGRAVGDRVTLFSPLLYSDNEVFYSLGAVILINLAILILSLLAYICRASLAKLAKSRWKRVTALLLGVAGIVGILAYTYLALYSIISNSGISLELTRLSALSPFCVLIYLSFITTTISVPLILQTLQPIAGELFGLRYNIFSVGHRAVFSVLLAIYLVAASSILGFRKEQDRMEIMSNLLAFDRDISLELHLRSIEEDIASDMVISALSVFNNTNASIRSRISDLYFQRQDRNYSISVYVFNSLNNTRAAADQYNAMLRNVTPISESSRFMYVKRENGHSHYLGVFLYLIEGSGISRVLVRIDPSSSDNKNGYASIFGFTSDGRASVPPGYSYARYDKLSLMAYRGNYSYPTHMDPDAAHEVFVNKRKHRLASGYRHFINLTSDDECVLLSRPRLSPMTYVVACILVALLSFMLMSIVALRRKQKSVFSHSYFRARISVVMLISLVLTLVVLATVSVLFVYNRNNSNNQRFMSERINSISSMLEEGVADIEGRRGVNWRAMRTLVNKVGQDTDSDITIYSPDGKMVLSTNPMVFDGIILGERINGEAYGRIIHESRRSCIIRDRVGPVRFYSMYSSVLGSDGEVIAIACIPYNENLVDFEEDAITHATTIISIFIVFLLIAMLTVTRIVDRMFRPLSEMSAKMSNAGLDSLELIDYDRDDEISSIVQAYNRMVNELMLSSRKLARAERDKAWSEMARQVAHEIKNPLTPMKLQIQRVLRLKEKNDARWLERFDEASKLLLDHIDILSDTAGEFSTFAKLYTEEPSEINLVSAIQSEISMFDNHENIKFEYIGLDDAIIYGPKPQLTRVFVNLLNNSIQAIGDKPDGHIRVSLRISASTDFYDIVFEDNGPGVSEDNIGQLFTPNFTTKSGGSGLGLAISRNILENCSASISYQRSFALGGACFSIVYPREKA